MHRVVTNKDLVECTAKPREPINATNSYILMTHSIKLLASVITKFFWLVKSGFKIYVTLRRHEQRAQGQHVNW